MDGQKSKVSSLNLANGFNDDVNTYINCRLFLKQMLNFLRSGYKMETTGC